MGIYQSRSPTPGSGSSQETGAQGTATPLGHAKVPAEGKWLVSADVGFPSRVPHSLRECPCPGSPSSFHTRDASWILEATSCPKRCFCVSMSRDSCPQPFALCLLWFQVHAPSPTSCEPGRAALQCPFVSVKRLSNHSPPCGAGG